MCSDRNKPPRQVRCLGRKHSLRGTRCTKRLGSCAVTAVTSGVTAKPWCGPRDSHPRYPGWPGEVLESITEADGQPCIHGRRGSRYWSLLLGASIWVLNSVKRIKTMRRHAQSAHSVLKVRPNRSEHDLQRCHVVGRMLLRSRGTRNSPDEVVELARCTGNPLNLATNGPLSFQLILPTSNLLGASTPLVLGRTTYPIARQPSTALQTAHEARTPW